MIFHTAYANRLHAVPSGSPRTDPPAQPAIYCRWIGYRVIHRFKMPTYREGRLILDHRVDWTQFFHFVFSTFGRVGMLKSTR